jgi:hypothetical protein
MARSTMPDSAVGTSPSIFAPARKPSRAAATKPSTVSAQMSERPAMISQSNTPSA